MIQTCLKCQGKTPLKVRHVKEVPSGMWGTNGGRRVNREGEGELNMLGILCINV
jgi:hypothetical protein